MRLYFPVDLTGNLIMIEKLVLGGIWTGDLPIFNPDALISAPSRQASETRQFSVRHSVESFLKVDIGNNNWRIWAASEFDQSLQDSSRLVIQEWFFRNLTESHADIYLWVYDR